MEAIFLLLISFYISEIPITEQYKIDCPPLPIIEFPNGKIRVNRDKVFFSCDNGFRLSGPTYLRCSQGNWSSTIIPKCLLPFNRCKPPNAIKHGSIMGDWNVGDEIVYFCDAGYRLLGDRSRKCLKSRHWDGIEPICQDENEPLTKVAVRLKNQFITKVGEYSSDSTARAIGVEITKIGLELIFLIDRSSSIDPIDFKKGIEFAKFLVDEFGAENGINNNVGTRVAFITFGDTADIVVNVNDEKIKNKEDAKNILDGLMPEGGGTAMTYALDKVIGNILTLLRPKAKRAIFLLTDGQNNVGQVPPEVTANDLKTEFAFEIFAVGIGQDINVNQLVKIASSPQKNHLFLLKKYSDLNDVLWLIRNNDALPEKEEASCGSLPESKSKSASDVVAKWPWLAVIYVLFPTKDNQPKLGICSGSLICPRWVLTSASCFYGEDKTNLNHSKSNVFVTVGEKHLALLEKSERNYYAVKVRIHPKFDRATGGSHDLALLKLNDDVPIIDSYRTICLPKHNFLFNENRRAVMIGWGNVPSKTFYGKHFASSFQMLPVEVNLPIARDFECNRVKVNITDDLFCAGSITNRTCAGNLGSPLVMVDKNTNLHYLIGMLVEREWCNTQFNVFIHVRKHIAWIEKVTNSCQNDEP
ncbi:complement C2-like [Centruroides vittatus]|uniref:complement C2-like n=1 Tax=Centruroides vittatus TaxID=120091 RepID=UPI00350FE9E4